MPIARWLLLLALALPGCAQIIQSKASTPSSSCVLPYSVTSGNVIVAISEWFNSTNTPSVSDTRSTSFSQAVRLNGGTQISVGIYVGTASSSGSDTITFSVSGAADQNISCHEFSSTFTTTTVDVSNSGTFSGTPASASSSLTTTINGDTLIGAIGGFNSNGAFSLSDNSFELVAGTRGDDSGAAQYKFAGLAGSYSLGFNQVGNSQGTIAVVALKPPSGVTVTSPANISDGKNGTAYSYTLGAVGGSGAYTWSITSGSLQSGLSLSGGGVISGTPTSSRTATVTVQATDGTNTGSKSITLKTGSSFQTQTVVQSAAPVSAGASVAFGSNATTGNLILSTCIGGFGTQATFYLSRPSDTLSTPFQFVSSSAVTNGSQGWTTLALWAGIASSSGADTVTCPASYRLVSISEISGTGSLPDVRVVTTGSGVTSGTATSGTITPTVANEVLYSAGTGYAGTATIQSPWTSSSAANLGGAGYEVVSSTSGTTVSYTLASNTPGTWESVATSFSAAAVAGAAPSPTATMILQ